MVGHYSLTTCSKTGYAAVFERASKAMINMSANQSQEMADRGHIPNFSSELCMYMDTLVTIAVNIPQHSTSAAPLQDPSASTKAADNSEVRSLRSEYSYSRLW